MSGSDFPVFSVRDRYIINGKPPEGSPLYFPVVLSFYYTSIIPDLTKPPSTESIISAVSVADPRGRHGAMPPNHQRFFSKVR